MAIFQVRSKMPAHARHIYRYHAGAGAFDRLVPPWKKVETISVSGGIEDGGIRKMKVYSGPISINWVAEHFTLHGGLGFRDVQIKGPFRKWDHAHEFEPIAHDAGILQDTIDYQAPIFGGKSRLLEKDLERMFSFRHERTRRDLERMAPYADDAPKTIIFTGGVGTLVKQLAAFLTVAGHKVYRVTYQDKGQGPLVMRPFYGGETAHPLDQTDVIIHSGLPFRESAGWGADPFEDLAWLMDALKTSRRNPELFIGITPQIDSFDSYTVDPSLEKRHTKPNEDTRLALWDAMETSCQRAVFLKLGCLIKSPVGYLVTLLLELESYLFAKEGAQTPEFAWISRDDAVGAIHHLIHHEDADGEVYLGHPQRSTRSQLQNLVLKHDFMGYTLQRLLRVAPWMNPAGQQAWRGPETDDSHITAHGFKFQNNTLAAALDWELAGKFPSPAETP